MKTPSMHKHCLKDGTQVAQRRPHQHRAGAVVARTTISHAPSMLVRSVHDDGVAHPQRARHRHRGVGPAARHHAQRRYWHAVVLHQRAQMRQIFSDVRAWPRVWTMTQRGAGMWTSTLVTGPSARTWPIQEDSAPSGSSGSTITFMRKRSRSKRRSGCNRSMRARVDRLSSDTGKASTSRPCATGDGTPSWANKAEPSFDAARLHRATWYFRGIEIWVVLIDGVVRRGLSHQMDLSPQVLREPVVCIGIITAYLTPVRKRDPHWRQFGTHHGWRNI